MVRYDPQAVLLLAIDFGKHHPCALLAQQPYAGGLHVLGGILGQDVFLDDFLPIVKTQIAQWFPEVAGIQVCCDPAGSHQNSQGTRFNGVDILRRFGYVPSWRENANAPDVRAGTIEAIAAHMRRRSLGGEAFQVETDPERWVRVSLDGPVHEPFLVDALEAGYVWDEHMVSVGNKQIRKPKKDGWFEHGMNCLEYLELTFGADKQTKEQEEDLKRKREREKVTIPQPSALGSQGWMS